MKDLIKIRNEAKKRNEMAVKMYFDSIVSMMKYHKTNEIQANKMREICSTLNMSNMMPSHFVDAGLMFKTKKKHNGEQNIMYSFTFDYLDASAQETKEFKWMIEKAIELKLNYVQRNKKNRLDKVIAQDERQNKIQESEMVPEHKEQKMVAIQTEIDFESKKNTSIKDFAQAMIKFLNQYI